MGRQFEEPSFEILPEGVYRVELEDIQDKETKTGRVQWLFTFTVLDEVDGDGALTEVAQANGQPFKLFTRIWPNMSSFLDTFDPHRRFLIERAMVPGFDVDLLVGETFRATVAHTEYNAKTYANITELAPDEPSGGVLVGASAAAGAPDFGDPLADPWAEE